LILFEKKKLIIVRLPNVWLLELVINWKIFVIKEANKVELIVVVLNLQVTHK